MDIIKIFWMVSIEEKKNNPADIKELICFSPFVKFAHLREIILHLWHQKLFIVQVMFLGEHKRQSYL